VDKYRHSAYNGTGSREFIWKFTVRNGDAGKIY
jgi:hypothetical protein